MLFNPIAADLDEMRPSVLPNLLLAVKNNTARGYGNVALFEVGPEFYGRKPGEQNQVATGVRCGMTAKKDWNGSARAYDVFDAKPMRWLRLPPPTGRLKTRRLPLTRRPIITPAVRERCVWAKTCWLISARYIPAC